MNKNLGTLTANLTVNTAGVARAQTAIINLQKTVMASMGVMQAQMQGMQTTLNGMATGATAASKTVQTAGKDMTSSFTKFQDSLTRTAMGFRSFGWLATTVLTVPIIAAGKAILSTYSDFEYSMQKIVGLVGVARAQVEEWGDSIREMGKRIGQTPKQLADALYFVTSSGFKTSQALTIVEQSAKAAASGMGETKDIADLVTSVMNAYGQNNISAAKTLDILTAAVREGKGEASDYARVLGSVIPFAAQLGISFDQVAGAVSAMTLAGASSANAATYLRNILMKLIHPASQSEKALRMMGTSSAELRRIISDRGLMAGLVKIRELTNKYGDEMMGEVIPNIRAMLAELILTGKNFEYNAKVMDLVTNSAGSLATAYQAVYDSVQQRLKRATASMNDALTELGKSIKDAVIPILESLANTLQGFTKWFGGLSDGTKKLILEVTGFAAAIGPLTLLLSALMMGLKGVLGMIMKVGGAFKWLSALKFGPWGLAAAGVAAVVGGLIHYKKKMEDAARANNVLNKTLVNVNGEIKKLGSLTEADFGVMDIKNLTKKNSYFVTMVKYYKDLMAYHYQLAGVSQADYKKAKKIMDDMYAGVSGVDQTRKMRKWAQNTLKGGRWSDVIKQDKEYIDQFQSLLDGSGSAINDFYDNWRETSLKGAEKATEVFEDSEFTKAMLDYNSSMREVEMTSRILGTSFDAVKAKTELASKALETIIGIQAQLGIKTPAMTSKLNELLTTMRAQEALEFASSLREADEAGRTFGLTFNVAAAKAELFKKEIEKINSRVSKVEGGFAAMGMSGIYLKMVVDHLTESWKKLVLASVSEDAAKTLGFLQAQKEAFGTMESEVGYLNEKLNQEQKYLEALYFTLQQGSKEWDKTVENIKRYRMALVDAKNAADIKYLTEVYKATQLGSDGLALLGARIDDMKDKLRAMYENQEQATEGFKELANEIKGLERALKLAKEIQGAFSDLFFDLMSGADSASKAFENFTKSIINSFKRMIADLMAEKMMGFLLSLFTGGAAKAGIGGLKIIGNIFGMAPGLANGGITPPRLAKGGIIPPGFPNDSFLARLSSNELILPLDRIEKQESFGPGQVVFRIGMDELVGILEKAHKKNSLY